MDSRAIAALEVEAAEKLNSKQYEQAFVLLNELAEKNSSYAFFSLGWMHETGTTGSIDVEMADYFYRCAAYLGREDANFEIGRLLMAQGEKSKARAAFLAGAEQGDVSCMARVGKMMVYGHGGAVDMVHGTMWLDRAADLGHIFAQGVILKLAEGKATTIFERLKLKVRRFALARRGAKEKIQNPGSRLLR